ncbi:MAG: DnaJ domain-containing protein [Treponema sp.]|nr:DnaJ domain-containing protein [Treponema sp.]
MGIWGRLGNVVKSYLNDDRDNVFGGSGSKRQGSESRGGGEWDIRDSDLNAAYEELDEFLRGDPKRKEKPQEKPARPVPAELREDFAELGLSPDASAAECKAAYKKLLKTHHPDRHAGKSEAMKKATEKTARVNAAYERIEKWQKN